VTGPVPVILDVDAGVDDACALLLAALHPGAPDNRVWHDPEAAAMVLGSATELDNPGVMYGLDVFYDALVTRAQSAALTSIGGRGPAELAGRLIDVQCSRFGQQEVTWLRTVNVAAPDVAAP